MLNPDRRGAHDPALLRPPSPRAGRGLDPGRRRRPRDPRARAAGRPRRRGAARGRRGRRLGRPHRGHRRRARRRGPGGAQLRHPPVQRHGPLRAPRSGDDRPGAGGRPVDRGAHRGRDPRPPDRGGGGLAGARPGAPQPRHRRGGCARAASGPVPPRRPDGHARRRRRAARRRHARRERTRPRRGRAEPHRLHGLLAGRVHRDRHRDAGPGARPPVQGNGRARLRRRPHPAHRRSPGRHHLRRRPRGPPASEVAAWRS